MPPEADPPRYEAFVVLVDGPTHSVLGLTSDPARTRARRVACLDDARAAARLADALNSRLLLRPNHRARLRAALDGLPLAVHAAVRQVPDGGTELLADQLPGDPIDGLLLFPTADTPAYTPRTAHAVAFAAEDVSDLCHEAAQAVDARTARRFLPRLPVPIRRFRAEELLGVAADLDQLATTLRSGLSPDTTGLAARLAVEHAERLHRDDPEIFADGSRLLPPCPRDYDFTPLRYRESARTT